MIDLSKLQKGDTVKFRCGGEAVVNRTEFAGDYANIQLEGSTHGGLMWLRFGQFDDEYSETDPFDIIEVIPKPFDWSEAKPGIVWFIGRDMKGTPVFQWNEHIWKISEFSRHVDYRELVRSTLNDISVTS